MPTKKRRAQLKQADQAPLVAYSDDEEVDGGFTVTGAEAMTESAPSAASTSGLPAMELPCTLQGVMSGLSGGALGYVFGFGGQIIRHRGKGRLRACNKEGLGSAKTFAIMGGLYTAANCVSKRIRQKDDAWNGFVSGCVTGGVLAWGGTPRAIAQSSLGFGAFSYVIDRMGQQPANAAATSVSCDANGTCRRQLRQRWPLQCASCSSCTPRARALMQSCKPGSLEQLLGHPGSPQPLLTPAALWLQTMQAASGQHLSALCRQFSRVG
ncbi:hypothetical protein ABBQ32_007999 [Trebouxia sp. C0010 RCD-2024]